MIEALFEAKKITPKEFKIYKLYSSELGSECLKDMMEELFWEEPSEEFFTETHFSFYDGRRSVLRGIRATLDKVQAIINHNNLAGVSNDG